jgi:hypothetical protein
MQKLIGSAESVHLFIFVSFHTGIGIPVESSHISAAKAALIKILNENLTVNLFVYICGCIHDCIPTDTIMAELTYVGCGGVDCIYLGQDMFQWLIFVITVMNLRVPNMQMSSLIFK